MGASLAGFFSGPGSPKPGEIEKFGAASLSGGLYQNPAQSYDFRIAGESQGLFPRYRRYDALPFALLLFFPLFIRRRQAPPTLESKANRIKMTASSGNQRTARLSCALSPDYQRAWPNNSLSLFS